MIAFREASTKDVPTLVRLLAADPLGSQREAADGPLAQDYADAFPAIDTDPRWPSTSGWASWPAMKA